MENVSISESQKIGFLGESILKSHLMRKGFYANKIEYDFGFDFDVQQMSEDDSVTGCFFKAQCKAVESGKYKYAIIEEAHMRLYLKTKQPICIFGVDLENNSIHHRFFDKDLAQKFIDVLEKGQKQICLNFETEMYSGAQFSSDAMKYCNGTYADELYTFVTETLLKNKVPGASLKSLIKANESHLQIVAPYISDVVNPLFIQDGLIGKFADVVNVDCQNVINQRCRGYKTILFGGVAYSSIAQLELNGKKIPISVWPRCGNIAYVMKSGLSLEVGPCEKDKNGMHFHSIICSLEKSAKTLFECVEDVEFFKNFMFKKNILLLEKTMDLRIDEFDTLKAVFSVINQVIEIKQSGYEFLDNFYLNYLDNVSYWNNIQILHHVIRMGKRFSFELFIDDVNGDNQYSDVLKGVLPIKFSLPSGEWLVKAICEYQKIGRDNYLVGVRFLSFLDISYEKLDDESACENPEMWICNQLPPVPFSQGNIKFPKEQEEKKCYLF